MNILELLIIAFIKMNLRQTGKGIFVLPKDVTRTVSTDGLITEVKFDGFSVWVGDTTDLEALLSNTRVSWRHLDKMFAKWNQQKDLKTTEADNRTAIHKEVIQERIVVNLNQPKVVSAQSGVAPKDPVFALLYHVMESFKDVDTTEFSYKTMKDSASSTDLSEALNYYLDASIEKITGYPLEALNTPCHEIYQTITVDELQEIRSKILECRAYLTENYSEDENYFVTEGHFETWDEMLEESIEWLLEETEAA